MVKCSKHIDELLSKKLYLEEKDIERKDEIEEQKRAKLLF